MTRGFHTSLILMLLFGFIMLSLLTPAIAKGLGLSQDWGVVVSDVVRDGPADKAGLMRERGGSRGLS